MPLSQDAVAFAKRTESYAKELSRLFEKYLQGLPVNIVTFKKVLQNANFQRDFKKLFEGVAEAEGGKITLATAGLIIGMAMGGIGLAGAWGAVGLPLAIILVPVGILVGNEADSQGVTKKLMNLFSSGSSDRARPK